jgi:hypothetical protein
MRGVVCDEASAPNQGVRVEVTCVGGGEQYPTVPDGEKPSWSADRKTCTLPVALKPNWQYRFGLNSRSFKNFASAERVPLEPVVYEFRTSPRN